MARQCLLGCHSIAFQVFVKEKTQPWSHRSNRDLTTLFSHPVYSSLINIPKGFVPWIGAILNDLVPKNLSLTLAVLVNSTAQDLAQWQWVLESLARVILDNLIALICLLEEQDDVWATANTSCCTRINTSDNVELELKKIRKTAQNISSSMSFNGALWFPVTAFSCLPSCMDLWLRSGLQILLMIVIGILLHVFRFKLLMLLRSAWECPHLDLLQTSTTTKIAVTPWVEITNRAYLPEPPVA